MPLSKTCITTLIFITTFLLSGSCFAQGKNESRTRYAIPYNHKLIAPPGMVYVRGGTTTINYDQSSTDTNSAKKVSLTSFFMDKTEVTNQQYRQFVEWVLDSIAIVNYLKDDQYFISEGNDKSSSSDNGVKTDTTAAASTTMPADSSKPVFLDSAKLAGATTANDSPITKRRINWAKVDHDKIFNSKDENIKSKIAPMIDENGNIKKEMCQYTYRHIKRTSAVTHNIKDDKYVKETVNVYPNENVWNQDLSNAQTDLFVENYFKAPPFDDYPVVGVTWLQAMAFCDWRSNNARKYYNMPDYMNYYRLIYTLPSEAQFVYAAQGYYDMIYSATEHDTLDTVNLFPTVVDTYAVAHPERDLSQPVDTVELAKMMQKKSDDSLTAVKNAIKAERIAKYEAAHKRAANGNLYLLDYIKMLNFLQNGYKTGNEGTIVDSTPIHRDINGMLANFKQAEGDYWEDGAALTLPVMTYAPNEFGLYNMEGNVSEWVMDTYSPSAFSFVSDINPQLLYDADSTDADVMKRKVIRGGSFISNAKSLSPVYRDMELMNVSHCFLGFRCVMQAPEIITKATGTRNRTQRGKKTPGKLSGVRLPEIH